MKEYSEKIRVLIVDDSPFSRRLITDSLDPYWFEVVGFADGFRSALEGYRTHMPDVVTMDISGQETEGLEVTRRIIDQEPDIKLVLLSNSQNGDFLRQAQANGARAMLRKPFEPDELMKVLRGACETDVVDDVFKNHYPQEFITCFTKLMSRFSSEITVQPPLTGVRLNSSGVSIIVGITGLYSGRMVFDLSAATANSLAARLLKQAPENRDQENTVMAEFADIVAKNATAKLNKEFRGVFLRVSPPAVFTGERFSMASPSLDVHAWVIDTPFGQLRLSVGFNKEVL